MARYYMNEKLSNPKYACVFRKEFVPVVQAGTHEFFREAASWERKELAKTNPEACQRYAESLKPKKKAKPKKIALASDATIPASSATAKPRTEPVPN